MRRSFPHLLAVALVPSLLSGCSAVSDLTSVSFASQNVTGNWTFGVSDPPGGPLSITEFTGALAGQGANISGTFRALGCISPTQDVTFTGSQAASGTITLTSTNLPNNVATITTTTLTTNGTTTGLGSLTITGSGPCAFGGSAALAVEFLPVTGTYAGTLTSTTGTIATVTAKLTQAAADSDGQFPETGTVTFATTACTGTFSLTGLVTGPTFSASLTSTSGAGLAVGSQTPSASELDFPVGINILSGGCNTGSFSGSLYKQ